MRVDTGMNFYSRAPDPAVFPGFSIQLRNGHSAKFAVAAAFLRKSGVLFENIWLARAQYISHRAAESKIPPGKAT